VKLKKTSAIPCLWLDEEGVIEDGKGKIIKSEFILVGMERVCMGCLQELWICQCPFPKRILVTGRIRNRDREFVEFHYET
jgi:hypothetical protein